MQAHEFLIQFPRGGLDQQLAAAWHGIARIYREIHYHLVEHSGIRVGHERCRMQVELQSHVLTDDPLQQLGQARDNFVCIQQSRVHHLAAAEQKQLASQVGRSLGIAPDLLQTITHIVRQVRRKQ